MTGTYGTWDGPSRTPDGRSHWPSGKPVAEYRSVCDKCWRGNWSKSTGEACGYGCGPTLRERDLSELAPAFTPFYRSGDRIRVDFGHGGVRTGTVSRTMGWRPSYMLMLTSRSMGSSWLLGPDDRIVAVKRGSRYVETGR